MQLQCDAIYLHSFLSVSVSNPNNQAQVICIPAPRGRGVAGFLTFRFLKLHCRAKFVVNFLLNAPPRGVDNNDICIHHDVLLQGNLALGPE